MPRKTSGSRIPVAARGGASMRPRPDAAENSRLGDQQFDLGGASMRPRPDAAENVLARVRMGRNKVLQ